VIPVDLVELLREELRHESKPRESLYPSSDLIGSLRHTQLSFVGAPKVTSDVVSDMRMETGTMWHKKIGELLEREGIPVMREVRLTPWMPEGWSGIGDLLFFIPDERAWGLRDLKTTKGEGIKWKLEKGMSEEHLWQVSTYWWGCYNMGLRMMDRFEVMYLPMSQVIGEEVEPVILSEKPLDESVLLERMNERWSLTQEYKASLPETKFPERDHSDYPLEDRYVTDALAPIQDRVQKVIWEPKRKIWNVILVPHWSAQFCPFPDELCSCSAEGTTKVGHYEAQESGPGVRYVVRGGHEEVEPRVAPTASEIRRRLKR
jgi:hypothetical protein